MRSGRDKPDIQTGMMVSRPGSSGRSRFISVGMLLIALMLISPLLSTLPLLLQDAPSENAARVCASPNIPRFRGTPPIDGFYANASEPFMTDVKVYDLDNDTVNVTWNWGDGTPFDNDTTPPAASWQLVSQTHVYNPPREPGMGDYYVNYTLNITLEDGTGNYNWREVVIHVKIPENIAPEVRIEERPGTFDPSDSVSISASAKDLEGEKLKWTFIFNDAVNDFFTQFFETPATGPGETVWQHTSYVFGAPGTYYVRVRVTDREGANESDPSHNVTGGPITIAVALNRLPSVADNITASSTNPVFIDAVLGYINVTFSITARDRDGEPLNATWDFDDGTPQLYNESAGGIEVYEFVQWRNYTTTGQFNVTVNVTDGRPGHNVVRYLLVNVSSTNRPPSSVGFVYNLSHAVYALPNELIDFTLILSDPEQNPIEVVVDFRDGSPKLYFNVSNYVDGNVTLEFSHAYATIGSYNLTINYTDNRVGLFEHNKSITIVIKIDVPPEVVSTTWSWWDYTSLGLFSMIPVLIVARMLMISRTRKQLEERGYTLEEWKLIQREMPEEETKTGGA